jgi:hypothetical protein
LLTWKLRASPMRLISKGLRPLMRWPLQQDVAGAGAEAPADQVEQRALAGAVGADDGHALALPHRQAGAADDLGLAEALAHVAQFDSANSLRAAHSAGRLRLISFSISPCTSPHSRRSCAARARTCRAGGQHEDRAEPAVDAGGVQRAPMKFISGPSAG